jgi:hypothetical protein
VLGLVENLAYVQVPERPEPYYLFGPLRGEAEAQKHGVPFWGALPIDPVLADACDQGKIQTYDNPAVRAMAQRLVAGRKLTAV